MITQQAVDTRIEAYRCCLGKAGYGRYKARVIGNPKLADTWWKRMQLIEWGLSIVELYDAQGTCRGQWMPTEADLCCVFKLLDPCCIECGCVDTGGVPTYPPDCNPPADYEVIRVVDVSERAAIEAAIPTEGDSYYVVTDTGGSGWVMNTIVTWTSGAWVSTQVTNGDRTLDLSTGRMWIVLNNNEPGLQHPGLVGFLYEAQSQYIIQSEDPQIALNSTRLAVIRAFIGGTWVIIFQGTEAQLAVPIVYNLQGLPITALEVVYTLGLCSWTAPANIVPPFGSCGIINAEVSSEADCGTGTFFVIVNIISVEGYPLGALTHTINGITQLPQQAAVGITLLGPFVNGSVIGVRVGNAQDSECDLDAGTFIDPTMPIAGALVASAQDASFEGSADLGVAYLIVSDTTGAGNTWARNVGSIWNGAIFIPTTLGDIIQTGAPGLAAYWQITADGPRQMYPEVIFAFTGGYPSPWTVVSQSPLSADGRFRIAAIRVLLDGEWTVVWAGFEDLLQSPVPVTIPAFPVPTDVSVTYYGGQCPLTVGGNVVTDELVQESACGPIQYFSYRYVLGDQRSWVFTNTTPGATMTIRFAQGTIGTNGVDVDGVIRINDGTSDSDTLIASTTGPDISGFTATSSGQSIYMEIDINSGSLFGQDTTWIFQVSCTPSNPYPDAGVTPSEDCDEYEFSLSVEMLYNGGTAATIRYTVNGGAPQDITGVQDFDINVLGPFPYESIVLVYVINEDDAAASILLGEFTGSGDCPVEGDPCAPEAFIKVNFDGDVLDIPEPPGDGSEAARFFVRTDTTNTGLWSPGSVLNWNIVDQKWDFQVTAPVGAVIYGPSSGAYWEITVAGIASLFPPIIVSPLIPVNGTNAFKGRIEQVQSGITTSDRNVALEVFTDGNWVQVWNGTEQDFVTPVEFEILQPFTITRAVYNWDTCAYGVSTPMDFGNALEIDE